MMLNRTSHAATNAKHSKTIPLQWLRWWAAVMVVIYHAAAYLQIMRGSDWGTAWVPNWFGVVGVSLFFALSGYLMATLMGKTAPGTFMLNRLVRIYPTFLVVTALFLLSTYISELPASVDPIALTLFPAGLDRAYPLGVEWTLIFELSFYIFVFLLILSEKQEAAAGFLIGWVALIFTAGYYWPDDPSTNYFVPAHIPFSPRNVAFAAGMLLPLIWKTRVPHPALALCIAIALFHAGVSNGVTAGRWAIGIGSALIVLSLAHLRSSGRFASDLVGDKLGGYTYALYLVHVPVIRTLYHLVGDGLSPASLFFLATSFSIAVGAAVGEIDLLIYEKLRTGLTALTDRTKTFLSLGFVAAFLGLSLFFTLSV